MKKIDVITVLVSSTTLLLFCFFSFLLIWQYSKIRDDIDVRTESEIHKNLDEIRKLDGPDSVDRLALIDQLESNVLVLRDNKQEWRLIRQTLTSFVAILIAIILSHLFFVYTLFKSAPARQNKD